MNRLLLACAIAAGFATATAAQAQVKDRYYVEERYIKDDRPVARHYFRAMGDSRSDAILEDEVEDALFDVLGRRASRIDVDVNNGHARLRGIVPSRRAFALAREIADDVPGIRTVSTNRLYVD